MRGLLFKGIKDIRTHKQLLQSLKKILHWAIQLGRERKTLERVQGPAKCKPGAEDSFLAFFLIQCDFIPSAKHSWSQILEVLNETQRERKSLQNCAGWVAVSLEAASNFESQRKILLVWWFNVLFGVLIPSQVFLCLRQCFAPEDRCFWCKSPFSLEKNPIIYPLHL